MLRDFPPILIFMNRGRGLLEIPPVFNGQLFSRSAISFEEGMDKEAILVCPFLIGYELVLKKFVKIIARLSDQD